MIIKKYDKIVKVFFNGGFMKNGGKKYKTENQTGFKNDFTYIDMQDNYCSENQYNK
jgi:hypothetical protein